jgi:hypothetical protein
MLPEPATGGSKTPEPWFWNPSRLLARLGLRRGFEVPNDLQRTSDVAAQPCAAGGEDEARERRTSLTAVLATRERSRCGAAQMLLVRCPLSDRSQALR